MRPPPDAGMGQGSTTWRVRGDARAPKGFHRIRHYGLLPNATAPRNIAKGRALLNVVRLPATPQEQHGITTDTPRVLPCPCPRCGGRMIVIEVFARGCEPRWRPMPSRVDQIMSQTALGASRLPVPMRWPNAGSDLSRRSTRSTYRAPR